MNFMDRISVTTCSSSQRLTRRHRPQIPLRPAPGWRRAINDGRIQFVVTDRDYTRKIPADITWTRTDPVAKLVVAEISLAVDGFSQLSVYAIEGTMSASGCPHG